METRDGFILGIHNYCDRWCERCPLTHRCQVFAAERQVELHLAPSDRDLSGFATGRPSLGAVALEERPAGLGAVSGPLDRHTCKAPGTGDVPAGPDGPPDAVADPRFDDDARSLQVRLEALTSRLRDWSLLAPPSDDPQVRDAREVLNYYWLVAGAKLHRALDGVARATLVDRLDESNGMAKVVLLALDRLEEAWLRLAERGWVPADRAEPLLQECAAVKAHVERRFPRARQFVRPGFDEPTAVAMLEWQERG